MEFEIDAGVNLVNHFGDVIYKLESYGVNEVTPYLEYIMHKIFVHLIQFPIKRKYRTEKI